jgi:hypothetical protein
MAVMRALVIAAGLALAGPAMAQDQTALDVGNETELRRFVEPVSGATACWGASFDVPEQQVTDMRLTITFEELLPDKNLDWPEGFRFYNYELRTTLRGHQPAAASGECLNLMAGGGIYCSVECDGGGVSVFKADAGGVRVDLGENGYIRLATCGGAEGGETLDLVTGPADREYTLPAIPPEQCTPVEMYDYLDGVD